MFRSLIYWLLFIGGMSILNIFCYQQTDGFFPYRIPKSLPYHPEWEITSPDRSVLDPIFSQPFVYLGKGHQCFVLQSQDGNYVLKLPFHSQMLPPLWLRPIPLISDIYHTNKLLKRQRKLQTDKQSYLLAYNQLQKETGLIYIHLNRTQSLGYQIIAFDKIGVQHVIPLDQVEFILQKKAKQLYPTLKEWMDLGQIELAKQGLSELVNLFTSRYAKGIEDRENVLDTNYGFLDGHPIQIDIGRLRTCEKPLDRSSQAAIIWSIFKPLSAYLECNYPPLATHLNQLRGEFEFPAGGDDMARQADHSNQISDQH